ncbi:hypothetical protein SAMN05216168_0205 [Kosakonia radicincitans]|nr:hypothetical protein SAMN05216168_0205 [Kosakonia radicincitans]
MTLIVLIQDIGKYPCMRFATGGCHRFCGTPWELNR